MGYGPAQHGPAWPRWSAALDLLQHFDPDAMALGAGHVRPCEALAARLRIAAWLNLAELPNVSKLPTLSFIW